jgi:NAD(P)-dependent dehydrogenase (short-subunit alcohol dehydrogenase family)
MKSTGTMANKVVMVTGASAGIGKATAKQLADIGTNVVMVVRNQSKGEQARQEILSKIPSANLTLLLADLSSQADIHRLAKDFKQRFNQLDVLINNAAIIPKERTLTKDGLETQFAVNHLAPFLLTNLLLNTLKATPNSRIVTVASEAHRDGVIDFNDLQNAKQYHMPRYPMKGWQAYSNSKLMNIHFTYELAKRLEGTTTTVNCLHPGVLGTELTRTLPPLLNWFHHLRSPKAEKGAYTSVYLASSAEVSGVTGKYFNEKGQAVAATPPHYDATIAKRLWQESERLARLAQRVAA